MDYGSSSIDPRLRFSPAPPIDEPASLGCRNALAPLHRRADNDARSCAVVDQKRRYSRSYYVQVNMNLCPKSCPNIRTSRHDA
jgi:hypothetical protein